MSDTLLLTGGTGFLGSMMIARLLEDEEGPDVVLLVRARDHTAAQERLDEVLARLYEEPPEAAARLRAVPAELTAPRLGMSAADHRSVLADVDRVVHCAASISFTLPLAEAREINVTGTAGVVELCRRLRGVERLVHVSTAYVAGRSEGTFGEDDLDVGQTFRNTYEQTKWEAEYLVGRSDLPVAVVRPSIVVGESDSGWTSAFNVVYWPLQAFARGLLDQVSADPEGIVDLVAVDRVVDVMSEALADEGASGAYHAVSGARALRVGELVERSCAIFGREAPVLLPPGPPDPEDPAAAFASYFDVQVRFGDERARALAGEPAPGDLVAPMLAYARATRWGKRPLTRQAAREQLVAD